MHSTFIYEGKEVEAPTLIEVAWFDRGQEVQDEVAECMMKHFGDEAECLEVYFIPLQETAYYENGEHF